MVTVMVIMRMKMNVLSDILLKALYVLFYVIFERICIIIIIKIIIPTLFCRFKNGRERREEENKMNEFHRRLHSQDLPEAGIWGLGSSSRHFLSGLLRDPGGTKPFAVESHLTVPVTLHYKNTSEHAKVYEMDIIFLNPHNTVRWSRKVKILPI